MRQKPTYQLKLADLEENQAYKTLSETKGLATLDDAVDASKTLHKDFRRNCINLEAKDSTLLTNQSYEKYLEAKQLEDSEENFECFLLEKAVFSKEELSEIFKYYNQSVPGFFVQLLHANTIPPSSSSIFSFNKKFTTTIQRGADPDQITASISLNIHQLVLTHDAETETGKYITLEEVLDINGKLEGHFELTKQGFKLHDSITTDSQFLHAIATQSHQLSLTQFIKECYSHYSNFSTAQKQHLNSTMLALHKSTQNEAIPHAKISTLNANSFLATAHANPLTFGQQLKAKYAELPIQYKLLAGLFFAAGLASLCLVSVPTFGLPLAIAGAALAATTLLGHSIHIGKQQPRDIGEALPCKIAADNSNEIKPHKKKVTFAEKPEINSLIEDDASDSDISDGYFDRQIEQVKDTHKPTANPEVKFSKVAGTLFYYPLEKPLPNTKQKGTAENHLPRVGIVATK